jgi:hypothetical protein
MAALVVDAVTGLQIIPDNCAQNRKHVGSTVSSSVSSAPTMVLHFAVVD